MSGALMAQVLSASAPGGKCDRLDYEEFKALMAIADRCRDDTRQASVPISRIMEVTGWSRRTAYRRLKEVLIAEGYVTIARPGERIGHVGAIAPIYELAGFLSDLPLRHAEEQSAKNPAC